MPVPVLRLALASALVAACALACLPGSPREEAGPATPTAAAVGSERLLAADSEPGSWMSYGRTYSEQRFSPLDAIDTQNVADLGLAWSFDLETERGIEATSIVVDGVMYATSAWSIVHALDARTGEKLWTYDPQVAKDKSKHACCDVVNRGVAVWEGRVYFGALDGRLIALDAATGQVEWSVATVDPALPYTITGAPRVIRGKVLIGNGGAEYGVRGYVAAYDADDRRGGLALLHRARQPRRRASRTTTMKMAATTWTGEWWKLEGGGGTVWDSFVFDPELDLLYVGVGNGTPWNQKIPQPRRRRQPLPLVDRRSCGPTPANTSGTTRPRPARPGTTPRRSTIILAELEIGGRAQGPDAGAEERLLLRPRSRDRRADLRREIHAPLTWATHVDMETGRPVETENARYSDGPQLTWPSYLGGHNWHPMSFNPETGLVYIPVLDFPANYGHPDEFGFEYRPGAPNLGIDGITGSLPDDQAERDALGALVKGRLLAWDPVQQEEAWRVEHPGTWNGGTLTTAGNLVFQGTSNGELVAFRANDGERLWSFPTQTGVVAPAMTYELDGEQYVSVNVGWGGAFALVFGEYVRSESMPNVSRVLTFKLGADGALPEVEWQKRVAFDPPEQTASPETIRKGYSIYQDVCLGCHGLNAVSGLLIPDLRGSAYLHDQTAFDSVVRDGALRKNGMAAFGEQLDAEETAAIRAYVIQQAWRGKALAEDAP